MITLQHPPNKKRAATLASDGSFFQVNSLESRQGVQESLPSRQTTLPLASPISSQAWSLSWPCFSPFENLPFGQCSSLYVIRPSKSMEISSDYRIFVAIRKFPP